ncbi:uncharacterized protein LOC143464827 [Clavelina lepadiformis]|uniref:uncharacterized protein LOC143464827 n=1 Tax=Clavelina lepadiformis TaxID=159417 RepID=UPI00404170C2
MESEEFQRNPDKDFVLHGKKPALKGKYDEYLTNSQKTLTSKNFSVTKNGTKKAPGLTKEISLTKQRTPIPTIDDLERSINDLKFDLHNLNDSLEKNYGRSEIFMGNDLANAKDDVLAGSDDEDMELKYLLERQDKEAVSYLPLKEHEWFSDPRHLTKSLGDFPTMQESGASRRSVSPIGRSVGRFGSEISTKHVYDKNSSLSIANNETTFPIRLSAPHIVGVRSLLPPKVVVREQNKERAKSPSNRNRSLDLEIMREFVPHKTSSNREKMRSPLPVWMPTSKYANASAHGPPPFKKNKSGQSRVRQSSAKEFRSVRNEHLSKSLPLPRAKGLTTHEPYRRPTVQPLPGHMELSFLRAADQIDTRRALVENSPYQQQLARLRLERLRVEEEYLLQLKRESELERIRGPKPKWYEMKGPAFHYECGKNTTVHKNSEHWDDTMKYRRELLESSREFTQNMKQPVPALE